MGIDLQGRDPLILIRSEGVYYLDQGGRFAADVARTFAHPPTHDTVSLPGSHIPDIAQFAKCVDMGDKICNFRGLRWQNVFGHPSSHEKFVVLSLRILKSFFAPYIRCSPPYLNNEHSLNRLTDTSPIHSYPDHCLQLP